MTTHLLREPLGKLWRGLLLLLLLRLLLQHPLLLDLHHALPLLRLLALALLHGAVLLLLQQRLTHLLAAAWGEHLLVALQNSCQGSCRGKKVRVRLHLVSLLRTVPSSHLCLLPITHHFGGYTHIL